MDSSKMYKVTFSIKADPNRIDDVEESLSVHLEKLKAFGDIEDCSRIIIE